MTKESFLRQFPKEVEYEASKLYNVLEMAREYEIISYTEEFYTPNFWKKLTKKIDKVFVHTNGIFENSDRRQIVFIPENYFIQNEIDKSDEKIIKDNLKYPSKLLKIKINSRFKEYFHKDFLGSILGLNIKRELMGDLILENGVGYIPVADKIENIILSDLKQIGKAPCKIEILDILNLEKLPSYRYDDKIVTVSSKRLDSIVASITNLSRAKVVEALERGKVFVDYYVEKDKSKNIEIGSQITIRGFGKYKLFEDKGETKKGKERILVKKYI